MIILATLAITALLFWVLLTLDRQRAWPTEMVVPDTPSDVVAGGADSVVAIVPARNEAETLSVTLPTLLQQDLDDFRVVLVDDGSTDDTAQIARRLATECQRRERLQIVIAGPPEDGWSGKVHALECGKQVVDKQAVATGTAPPEWLLLTDADIRHRPGSIRGLLQQAHTVSDDGPFDLVSVMARLRAEAFWERLVVPAFVFFFQLLYPFRRVASRSSAVAAAAGGCVLVRRTALEDAGGFAAIGGEIIDDVALGCAIKRRGNAVWLGFDAGIVSVRAYHGLADLWRMVSRTAFDQLRYRWDLLLLTLLALGILLVSPVVILASSVIAMWTSGPRDPWPWLLAGVCALLAWTLMCVAYLPAIRHHGLSSGYSATLPVAGVLFGLMTASSAFDDLRGKGPTWRGRRYQRSRDSVSPPFR